MVSNCLIWGFWQYLRKGGYIIFRQANKPWPKWVPHCYWSPDLHEFWEWSPAVDRPRWPLFRGKVKLARPVSDKWIEGFAAGVKYVVEKRK